MIDKSINKIKIMLIEVLEDENSCNEGSLSIHFDSIIDELNLIQNQIHEQFKNSN